MSARPDAHPLELARRLVDGNDPLPADAAIAAVLEVGWAVKDLCYASWSSDPQRAVRASQALRRLRDAAAAASPPSAALPELDALSAWTEGIAELVQGEMEAAIASLDAAAAAFVALEQPRAAAQTQVPKIMALAMRGRHDDAAHCAQAARHALLEHGDLHGASKVSLNLGNLHLRADRYAAAAACFRDAAVLFAREGDPEHSIMADIGLADALTAFGDFGEALRIYARARSRAAAHRLPVLEALVEESKALLDLVRGGYREALAGLERARRRYAELAMPQHLAIAEKQLADAYLEVRLLPEALAGYDVALASFQALGMEVDRAWTLVQRGRALALAGQTAAATSTLHEAASSFAALGNSAGAAAVALALAELALAGGDAQRALAHSHEAASLFQGAGLVERQLRAETVHAQALLRTGDLVRAWTAFDSTLDAARARGLLPVQLRCLTGRAIAARIGGDRRAARADLEAAVDLFEDQRRTLPGDELRSAFQCDHLQPFQELLRLELDALDAEGAVDATRVLERLDRFRARTLADRLGSGATGDEPRRESAEMQDLRARLAWLYRRLQRLLDEAADATALSADLRTAERELHERVRRLRLAAAADAPAGDDAELDVGALMSSLAEGDALVEYGVLDDELFACVVTRDGVRVRRRLAAWSVAQDAVQAMRFQIETLRHGSTPVQRHLTLLEHRAQAHLGRLHALVWQPLVELLGPSPRRLLIVPHAQLGAVPFAALHDQQRCLAEVAQIALVPSARLAQRALARRPRRAHSVVALGASARLPHAAREAKTVAGLLAKGQAFVGAEATLAALRAQAADADVVHLACHAQFRTDNPLFSALHLADGALDTEAVETLALPDALVVLSGCETALHAGGSDEMFGLMRAFLVAGAARVLAALWPVDDAVTAELMADLYGGLRRGQPPAAALRQAQLALRKRHPHPVYWSSFALTGGW